MAAEGVGGTVGLATPLLTMLKVTHRSHAGGGGGEGGGGGGATGPSAQQLLSEEKSATAKGEPPGLAVVFRKEEKEVQRRVPGVLSMVTEKVAGAATMSA